MHREQGTDGALHAEEWNVLTLAGIRAKMLESRSDGEKVAIIKLLEQTARMLRLQLTSVENSLN